MVTERTAQWAASASTADLLWAAHDHAAKVRTYQGWLDNPSPEHTLRHIYARALDDDRRCLHVIEDELGRRGHAISLDRTRP